MAGAAIVLTIVGIVLVKVVRAASGTATPRRREFNRVVRERHDAVLALHEIKKTIRLYRGQLDIVGDQLVTMIEQIIENHDQADLKEKK